MCKTKVILKDNKTKPRLSTKKRVSQAVVTMNTYTQLVATNPKFPQCLWKQQCRNQNDHWHGCLHWHTQRECFCTHQSKEQWYTVTIVQAFACLWVHQPISCERAIIEHHLLPNRWCNTLLHILKGDHGSFLSCKTATALGIVNLQVSHIHDYSLPQERLLMKYPTLFQGIGKLRGVEVKLHIDKRVNPVTQQPKRIPFHIRQKVEAELRSLKKRV